MTVETAPQVSAAQRRRIVLQATLAFVIGATIMVLVHESSHSAASALLGYRPVQLPFAVLQQPSPTPADLAIIAFTGPVTSLVLGLVGALLDGVLHPFSGRPFWRLVWLFAVFGSIQEGVGYFVISVVGAGDTGTAYGIWGVPDWVYYVSIGLGMAAVFGNGWLFAGSVKEISRNRYVQRALTVWPWVYGTIAFLILMAVYVLVSPGIGIDSVVAVMMGAVSVGVYSPISMMFSPHDDPDPRPSAILGRQSGGWVLLAVLVAINLFLTRGIWWP